jgi:penicillin-binding protein 1A
MNAPADRSLKRAAAPPRPRWLRITLKVVKWGVLSLLALGAIGAITLAILFWKYDSGLPRIDSLKDYKPKQVTRILASDGQLLGELYEERRSYVSLDRISPVMIDAIIDAEDADFRKHEGLDWIGMVRALWVNVKSGKTKQGASTITQQVVKTFLLTPERSLKRKVQEIILARRLEKALTKDEILTLYLNQIYFGHGRYGIEEASRFYFDKPASDLEVGEAAMLAGIVQSPENHSPLKNLDHAVRRQRYVLDQMVLRGHLTAARRAEVLAAGTHVKVGVDESKGIAPELVEVVRRELAAKYGEDALMSLGMSVKTTIDPELQRAARESLEAGLRALDGRQKYRGPLARLSPERAADKKKLLAKELGKAPREGQSYEAVVVEVSDDRQEMTVDLGGWTGAVLLWHDADGRYNPDKKKPSERFAPNDVVRVRLLRAEKPKTEGVKGALLLDQGPQGAVVVIDPKTRHVLAMVGGYDFTPGSFNRALRAKRQPGSAFKPFVYAAALDSGEFTPATIVNDAPEVYDLWKPKNYEKGKFLGPIRIRQALAKSINTVAIRVMYQVGPDKVVDLAKTMGISSELPRELSLALGSGEVTPLEMTNAFTTFAADGNYAPPVFVTAMGQDAVAPAEPVPALRPEIAYLMTSLMTSVVEEGTATQARKLKRPIAGKTGTSNEARDAWFVGYTPDLVVGVWIGFDDQRRLGRGEVGGSAAVPVFVELMKTATKGKSPRTFKQPPGVTVVRVDKKTGKLAPPGAADADVIDEVFLEGTVPTEVAPAPGEVDPSQFLIDGMEGDGEAELGGGGE